MKLSERFPKAKITALVVDSQLSMRRVFCRALTEMGVEHIEECSNGEEAVRKLERIPQINLVVTDLHMERLSGYDVVTYIRTRSAQSDIPILMASGDMDKEVIIKARACGIDDFCAKPIMQDDFKKKIWTMMEAYLAPSPVNLLFQKGDELFVAGKYYEALAVFREAKVEVPASPRSDFSIAQTFYRLGQESEAIRMLIKNSRQHILYFKNYALLADIYIKQKKLHKAIEFLRKELNINPRQPHRCTLLGRIFLKLNKFSDAEEWFKKALKESPRYEKAMWGHCYSLYKMENLEKCFSQVKKIRRYHPKNKKSLELLMILGRDPDWRTPVEHLLRDEINKCPNHLVLYFCLSKHFFVVREYQKSLETMKRVLKISPANKDVVRFIESIRENSPEMLTG